MLDRSFDFIHKIRITLQGTLHPWQNLKICVLEFRKIESNYDIKYRIFNFSTKVERIINDCDINDVFESI